MKITLSTLQLPATSVTHPHSFLLLTLFVMHPFSFSPPKSFAQLSIPNHLNLSLSLQNYERKKEKCIHEN